MLIRHLWQLKTVVFLHWCLICAVLLQAYCITSCTVHARLCTLYCAPLALWCMFYCSSLKRASLLWHTPSYKHKKIYWTGPCLASNSLMIWSTLLPKKMGKICSQNMIIQGHTKLYKSWWWNKLTTSLYICWSRGNIFSHVRPFYERAASNLDP